MPVEWSGSGPALLVRLDRSSAIPLRVQLEDHLRDAIRSGRLLPGERMPSSRVFASQLGISRGLVQDCYSQLQAEGYLVAIEGSGTRVARNFGEFTPLPARPVASPGPSIADFKSGVPDLRSFPRDDWAWAVRYACRTVPNDALDYGDPRGDERLRGVLAAYVRRVRAAYAEPDQVIVCSGFSQALGLVLRALALRGLTTVAFEDPGSHVTVKSIAASVGISAVPVAVDENGLDVEALEGSGAGAVVLTPAHQWPTGVVLAPERRHQLVAWAHRTDSFVIEDDYDAEFRYDREPVGVIQGLAPDRVVALGTVSKSLAPALRLGWAVVPAALAHDVGLAKWVADRATATIDQRALAALIESGRYDRHLRRMRTEYASRRRVMIDSLDSHAPNVRLTGLAAGFHTVVGLPQGADEQRVVDAALERGVGVYGMNTFRTDKIAKSPQLVLGFGNTGAREIAAGIEAIADLLHSR